MVKVSRGNGILKKISKILKTETLKLIYYAIIHPHLQYCNVVWGNAQQTNLLPLIRFQKKSIRRISRADYLAHTNELFKYLKILKLSDLYKLENMKFTHKEISKPNSKFFTKRRNNHAMRLRRDHDKLLHIPLPRSERSRKFSSYHAAVQWNDLPVNLLQVQNPTTFKINMKKLLICQYQIYCN